MAAHVHDWRVTHYLLLGLPTADGWAERVVRYACTESDLAEDWQMAWPLGKPILSRDVLEQQRAQEQARGGPLAWMAKHQQAAPRRRLGRRRRG